MKRSELIETIRTRKSFLCVGLDTVPSKLPVFLKNEPDAILTFNKQIVDATREYCVAYKPNFAFYEAMGTEGWDILRETVSYIGENHLCIADAKRGDIGNTASQYAKAIFEDLNFDAITIAPYMGEDSVRPFLEYEEKWSIVLGLTSNPGHSDFQLLEQADGSFLFEKVIEKLCTWGSPEQLMLVVGATRGQLLQRVRQISQEHFWLVPGVGAQGGSLEDVWQYGKGNELGLLVNSSRGIQYASGGEDFAEAASHAAASLQKQMAAMMQAQDW